MPTPPLDVIIAGGGVAGLEALLALQEWTRSRGAGRMPALRGESVVATERDP